VNKEAGPNLIIFAQDPSTLISAIVLIDTDSCLPAVGTSPSTALAASGIALELSMIMTDQLIDPDHRH
jgi:hypothetical protein